MAPSVPDGDFLMTAVPVDAMDGDGGRDDPGSEADAPSTPTDRRRHFVRAITESRRTDRAVTFVAGAGSGPEIDAEDTAPRVEYEDGLVRLELDDGERARLEGLLEEYRVFKIDGPATRTAPAGVVYVTAVADAKHTADFVESVFRGVFGLGEGYAVGVA